MRMIPQRRSLTASATRFVAALAVVAGAAFVRAPAAPAADAAATSAVSEAGTPTAPVDGRVGDDAVGAGKELVKAGGSTSTDGGAAKGASPSSRRAVTKGGGDPALAAEKAAIDGVTKATSIDEILARTLPRRSDRRLDWSAGAEPLHRCGEPRWIEPCIPLPPCHPSHPPHPYDLVGVDGEPTCGPIYRGPCCPRTGTHDDGPLPRLHRVNDRLFDAFYRTK